MAKPVTEEELQLRKRARRRLIGAIALVAVVAAVLPMVLDTDPKPTSTEVNIQIPSPDAKVAAPLKAEATSAKNAPSKAEPQSPPTPPVKGSETTVSATEEKSAPDPVAAKPAEKAPEKKAAEKKAAEKVNAEKALEKGAKPGPGSFYIQVTALAEADKAKSVQQQIAAAGVRAYTETVTVNGAKVTRVRAGPFATRDDAERARSQLVLIGLDGRVAASQ